MSKMKRMLFVRDPSCFLCTWGWIDINSSATGEGHPPSGCRQMRDWSRPYESADRWERNPTQPQQSENQRASSTNRE